MQHLHAASEADENRERPPIRVLVTALRPAERAGLRALLEDEPGVRVVGEAATASPPTAAGFDVVVIALSPGESPAGVTEGLAAGVPAVLLGSWSGLVPEALGAGPRAFLDDDADGTEIAAAVRAVVAGLSVLGPGALAALQRREPANDDLLTPRELEVLQLLAVGLPNKTIALRLQISEHTAKFHVGSILSKLGAESRTEAVMLAVRRGLLPL
ncbi:MAG: response regulator transcription factor [Dehalococcoidia bacterium]|nr:response regulator transcription factor [Dehalococcoidia bacterium]